MDNKKKQRLVFSAVTGESTTAIYESEELKRHFKLLQHFLNEDPNYEKQALFGLQHFVDSLQHPPGILQVSSYDQPIK